MIPIILLVLSGLFLGSKQFAYVHISLGGIPLYITEVSLLVFVLGIFSRIAVTPNSSTALPSSNGWIWLLWFGWGSFELMRNIDLGIAAIRDFALVYYAVFFFVGYYLARHFKYYRNYGLLFVVLLLCGVLPRLLGLDFGGEVNLMVYAFLMSWVVVFFDVSCRHKKIIVSCLAVLLFWMFLSWPNRSLILGFIVSLIPCYMFGDRHLRRRSVLLFFSSMVLVPLVYIAFSHLQLIGHSGTAQWRALVWVAVFERSLDTPVVGHGLGVDAITLNVIPDYASAKDPHNVLLTLFFQYGIFGVCIFLLLVVKFYFDMGRVLRKSAPSSPFSRTLIVLFSTHLNLFFFAITNVSLEGPHHGVWFWLVMGIAYAVRGRIWREGRISQYWLSASLLNSSHMPCKS